MDDNKDVEARFEEQTLTVHLKVEVDKEKRENKEKCENPDIYKIIIRDKDHDTLYLCVEGDVLRFQVFDEQDPQKFLWKIYACENKGRPTNVLSQGENENEKFLTCQDEGVNKVLRMREGKKITPAPVDPDTRFFLRRDYATLVPKFTLESYKYKGWYMAVDPGSWILNMTQRASSIHYFALYEDLKGQRLGSSHDTCITEKTDAGQVQI